MLSGLQDYIDSTKWRYLNFTRWEIMAQLITNDIKVSKYSNLLAIPTSWKAVAPKINNSYDNVILYTDYFLSE